ncbi:MAG: oligosaccharide flippase family protein, partial [Ferruginibacter sp.]
MKERLISIYKNTTYRTVATYVFVLFFSRGVSFLLLPLFTNPKYLTPADNGMLSIFSSNLILLTPFITLGLVQSSSRDFFAKDEESFKKSFTQNIIIALVMMVFVIGFLLLFKNYFNNKLHINGMLLFIIPLLIYLTLFNDMFLTILRNKNEVRFFSIINICKTILEYGASVLLVVFLYKGWYGRVGGIIVAALTINFISLFYLWKKQYLRFDFKLKHISEEI